MKTSFAFAVAASMLVGAIAGAIAGFAHADRGKAATDSFVTPKDVEDADFVCGGMRSAHPVSDKAEDHGRAKVVVTSELGDRHRIVILCADGSRIDSFRNSLHE